MKMSNRWNQLIYRIWAPIYDQTVNRLFLPGRKRAVQLLDLKAGEKVLLVGVGTGADLPLLPEGIEAVGVDLSEDMLARARSKLPYSNVKVTLIHGDAQQLLVEASSFDAVIFNLILSVIPDGSLCLRENMRALKPAGRAVIFDKFVSDSGSISLARKILNFFSTLFGTDITRSFQDMLKDTPARVIHQEESILKGNYRLFLIKGLEEKNESQSFDTSVKRR
jgi:phosphatidylethanolamine/phosphatidyl-N-methylethanolamine N-methyltransferase